LLRAALAAVFIYHGLDKVQQEKNFGGNWAGDMLPMVLQFLVAWGELLCGVAIALGLLTRVAALGIIVIMVGAIFTVTGQKGFSMVGGGFEYNYVLILVAGALALTGAGTFSLDRVVQLKTRGPAKY
jgi:putative oxidoreductase